MQSIITTIYFLLTLFGFEGNGTTVITRSTNNGADVIYSRTHIQSGVARFECIASASGKCHYTVFPRKCASLDGNCGGQPLDRLTVPAGSTLEVAGLPAFDACVSQSNATTERDCSPRR